MTVCIAAICEENTADPKIVLCTDRKISSALGSSEQTLKIRVVGQEWRCLFAGDEPDFLGCIPYFRRQFRSVKDIDETNACDLVRKALQGRRLEKIEELIQSRFSISYSELRDTGKIKLPDDTFRSAMSDVEMMEVRAEFLAVGYAYTFPMIIKTDKHCHAVIRENFAAIGEGAYLAQASLLRREHDSMRTLADTLYNVFEAKKFAEGAPTVGKKTTFFIFHATGLQAA
jgi:20S proteasome alpha/beta subunit